MSDLKDFFLSRDQGDLYKWHHYFEVYERHFSPYRGKDVVLLEIGISQGGSLKMWRSYFGESARIVGIDINEDAKRFAEDGFEIYIGDQADSAFLTSVLARIGQPDIIIDDGGHTSNQQIVSFQTLYPRMKDDAVYLVEDTHTSFLPGFQDRLDGQTFLDFATNHADKLSWLDLIKNIDRFKTPPEEREGDLALPFFTRTTFGVSFYNGIVVFERRKMEEPWTERR